MLVFRTFRTLQPLNGKSVKTKEGLRSTAEMPLLFRAPLGTRWILLFRLLPWRVPCSESVRALVASPTDSEASAPILYPLTKQKATENSRLTNSDTRRNSLVILSSILISSHSCSLFLLRYRNNLHLFKSDAGMHRVKGLGVGLAKSPQYFLSLRGAPFSTLATERANNQHHAALSQRPAVQV